MQDGTLARGCMRSRHGSAPDCIGINMVKIYFFLLSGISFFSIAVLVILALDYFFSKDNYK